MKKIEIVLPKGGVLEVTCSQEFLDIVEREIGANDNAAIRQFLHKSISSAIDKHVLENGIKEQ